MHHFTSELLYSEILSLKFEAEGGNNDMTNIAIVFI